MDTLSPLASYDVLRFAPLHLERLVAVQKKLNAEPTLQTELGWIVSLVDVMKKAAKKAPKVLTNARKLPELAAVREDFADDLKAGWVEALEKLHAEISEHVSARSPLVETLFPHTKLPTLLKANRASTETYAADFDRRAQSSYVTRMQKDEAHAFLPPLLDAVKAAWGEYQSCFAQELVQAPSNGAALRSLISLGAQLDELIQKSRLVAEAALLTLDGAYAESGLNAKPKRRTVSAPAPVRDADNAAPN